MKKIFTFCAVLLVAATTFAQAPRYGIKSGTYKTEMDMMGQTITNTVYFDDYGAKEATSMSKECTVYTLEMNQMGQTAKATVCVWQGFTMKTTIDAGGFAISTKIVEIKEGPVDAAVFEVPKF